MVAPMNSTKPLLPLFAGLTISLASSSAAAVPLVDLAPGALDPQPCNGGGCWTNHLRVTDLDGDGDLDILLANYGDFFSGNDSPEPLVVYENDGSGAFSNVSADAVGGYTGNLRMIAVGDVDGDGSPDIYGPQGDGSAHVLLINDGSGVFVDEADVRLPTDYPASGAARMGDVDGDGDLDIFAADAYAINGPPFGRLYINDGAGMFSEADGAIPDSISGVDIDDVEFADVDRDLDLDLIVNAHAGGTGALWLNDGSGVFAAGGTLAPPGPGSNFHYNVTPCDVDGDGDLDLWFDNTGGGYTEQLQINDGSGNFTDETDARVSGNFGADDNGVACADVDDDGDFDAVVLSLQTPERLFVNDGTGNFAVLSDAFPPPTDSTLWGEFGDLDGDGRLDLVTGAGEFADTTNKVFFGNEDMAVDTTAPQIVTQSATSDVTVGEATVVLFAVSDNTVTDEGPRLSRAYAMLDVGGAMSEVDGWFVGGDLFRVELDNASAGTVSLELCAEDRNGNIGCSEPVTYEVADGGGDGDGDPSGDGDGDGDPSGDGDGDGDGDPSTGDGDGDPSGEGETGDTGGAGAEDSGDGCACSLEDERNGLGWSLLSLIGLGVLIRRKR